MDGPGRQRQVLVLYVTTVLDILLIWTSIKIFTVFFTVFFTGALTQFWHQFFQTSKKKNPFYWFCFVADFLPNGKTEKQFKNLDFSPDQRRRLWSGAKGHPPEFYSLQFWDWNPFFSSLLCFISKSTDHQVWLLRNLCLCLGRVVVLLFSFNYQQTWTDIIAMSCTYWTN